MKILLINGNPVVSRLLVLCTRDESVMLDEVASVDTVRGDGYDIIFVDEASYGIDVAELLTLLGRCKKVYISYDDEAMKGFDTSIKKPFLPSQILELMENLDVQEDVLEKAESVEEDHFISPSATEETSEEKHEEDIVEGIEESDMISIFPLSENDDALEVIQEDEMLERGEESPSVLDENEINKIKALLDIDEEELELPFETLSDDEYETRKIEVIKEQLMADGLEIVGEEEIVKELSATGEKRKEKKRKKSKRNKEIKKNRTSKKKKKKEVTFTEEELESIEDAIEVAVGMMTKKQMKKLLKGKKIEVSIELEGDK